MKHPKTFIKTMPHHTTPQHNTTQRLKYFLLQSIIIFIVSCQKTRIAHQSTEAPITIQGQTFGQLKTSSKLACIFAMLAQVIDPNIITKDHRYNRLIDGSENTTCTPLDNPNTPWHKSFGSAGIDLSLEGIQDPKIKQELQTVQKNIQVLYEQIGKYDVLNQNHGKDAPKDPKALLQAHHQLVDLHKLLNESLTLSIKAKKKSVNGSEVLKKQLKMVQGHVPSGVILYKEIAKNKKQRAAVKNYYAKKLKHKLKDFEVGVRGYGEVKKRLGKKIQATKDVKDQKLTNDQKVVVNEDEFLKTREEVEDNERELGRSTRTQKTTTGHSRVRSTKTGGNRYSKKKGNLRNEKTKKSSSEDSKENSGGKMIKAIQEESEGVDNECVGKGYKGCIDDKAVISITKDEDTNGYILNNMIEFKKFIVFDKQIMRQKNVLYAYTCEQDFKDCQLVRPCAYITGWNLSYSSSSDKLKDVDNKLEEYKCYNSLCKLVLKLDDKEKRKCIDNFKSSLKEFNQQFKDDSWLKKLYNETMNVDFPDYIAQDLAHTEMQVIYDIEERYPNKKYIVMVSKLKACSDCSKKMKAYVKKHKKQILYVSPSKTINRKTTQQNLPTNLSWEYNLDS